MEINQLNDTIAELEIKHNEVKTENKMLKRRIEQLRELSKVLFLPKISVHACM